MRSNSLYKFLILITLLFIGCAHLRQNGILSLQFSEQASTAIMNVECNGVKSQARGVFVCEEKEPNLTKLNVKILPVPGRIIYSNGLVKKVEDFNWGKEGAFFWKKGRIKDTWVALDFGELNTIFGDTPIALDVVGNTKNGVIVNRGIFYHRRCNDRDIPCSYLTVNYECLGEMKNTWDNQIGFCNRMSGSSQAFKIPLQVIGGKLSAGSKLIIVSGRAGFNQVIDITNVDVQAGYIKFSYPYVANGPDLIGFRLNYLEQGVQKFKQTYILLVGFEPSWTGIDKPHYESDGDKILFSMPVLSDLMEVVGPERLFTYSGQLKSKTDTRVCAYAWQRQSGDVQKTCLNNSFKEIE